MLESALRKTVSAAAVFVGLGYVLPSTATIVMLSHFLSLYSVGTSGNIFKFSGIILFIAATALVMAVGAFIVIGGVQYYDGKISNRIIFLGVLFSAFYLLCLGTASALILQKVGLQTLLLIASSVLLVAATAVYRIPSLRLKSVACLLGASSGVFLATATLNSQILDLVFNWNVPFLGPFMSTAILEGLTIVLASLTALIYSIVGNGQKPVVPVFFLIVALIYGIGVFVGSLILSLNFLNLLWKAPWELALHGQPGWVLSTVIFWAASLDILLIGGVFLILFACMGFVLATKEFCERAFPNAN